MKNKAIVLLALALVVMTGCPDNKGPSSPKPSPPPAGGW